MTLIHLEQVRLPEGDGQVFALVGNRIVTVGLQGLTIANGELRAVFPARPIRRKTFRPAAKIAEYVIDEPIAGGLLVYRNGLLMTEPDDYAREGQTIRFSPSQVPGGGDIVNVLYEIEA